MFWIKKWTCSSGTDLILKIYHYVFMYSRNCKMAFCS